MAQNIGNRGENAFREFETIRVKLIKVEVLNDIPAPIDTIIMLGLAVELYAPRRDLLLCQRNGLPIGGPRSGSST
jgi:hypothetical protein